MLKSVRVRDYMLTRPVVVAPDTDIFEAIHQILVNKISGVTVVDGDGRLTAFRQLGYCKPEETLEGEAAKSARTIAGAARLESSGSGSTYEVGTKPDSSPRITRLHPSLTGASTTRSTSS